MNMDQTKAQEAAPPAYGEVYPSAPQPYTNPGNIGWQPNQPTNTMVQQPLMHPQVNQQPMYQQQVYQQQVYQQPLVQPQLVQQAPTILIYNNQMQVGPYPTSINKCPQCHQPCVTRTSGSSSILTHVMALILCFMCCLGCLPYMCSCFENTDHRCSKCRAYIGTYRRDVIR